MDFLVRLKIAQCRELFRAHLTLERAFTCVRPENIPRLLFIGIIPNSIELGSYSPYMYF